MPELPEVETVRRTLLPLIVDQPLTAVVVRYPKMIVGSVAAFKQSLRHHHVVTIDRRGKYLLFRFDHGITMVSHLRMEGHYFRSRTAEPRNKHVHVLFVFADGSSLQYQDVRKFGRMQLIKTGHEAQVKGLVQLGPEPFGTDFTVAGMYQALQRHHKAIKSVLLDQHVVAGLGNIYADEVLWLCRINPFTPANQLSRAQVIILHKEIIAELKKAVAGRGTSIRSYVDANGNSGDFQLKLHVYHQTGQPCSRCGTPIIKTKLGGRGTHYCPQCQPLAKED